MEFRKCSIGGVMYGRYEEEDEMEEEEEAKRLSMVSASGKDGGPPMITSETPLSRRSSKLSMIDHMTKFYRNPYLSESITFGDEEFAQDLFSDTEQSKVIKDFFTHLAVCHTVLAEYPDDSDDFKIIYKAQSPDEAALVTTAKDVGFAFIERVTEELTVSILGSIVKFQILDIIEFTSSRKRMSVIVKADNKIILYCKGADSIIYERLGSGQEEIKESTFEHLGNFATEGK
jgi:phospholipid-translocating ATPase